MKCRQIFYASLCGKSTTYEGTDLVNFDELADKSKQTLPAHEVAATLKTLQDARILPEGRAFKMEECAAIESVLKPYVETDNKISYENLYFALQSQVLCKSNYEAAVMLRVMKFFCCCFAVFMGFLAAVLQQAGLGLGFVYMSMGIFVGPAVAPAAMAILMEKASAQWCTIGAIAGLFGGVATWIITAQVVYEEITLSSLGGDSPFLLSNIVSICFSGLVAIAGSLANPDTAFQWKYLSPQLPLVDDMPPPIEAGRTAAELDVFLIKS